MSGYFDQSARSIESRCVVNTIDIDDDRVNIADDIVDMIYDMVNTIAD